MLLRSYGVHIYLLQRFTGGGVWNQTASALYDARHQGGMRKTKMLTEWNRTDDDALYDARRLGEAKRTKKQTEWNQTNASHADGVQYPGEMKSETQTE